MELAEKIYAASLFEAAQEADKLDEIHAQLLSLSQIFSETPEFLLLLSAPTVTAQEKHRMIEETLKGRIDPYLYNFMLVLSDKHRANIFDKICREFTALYNTHYGIVEVTAVTAIALSDEQSVKLTEKLEHQIGGKVRLHNEIDPSILGGVVLKYDSKELDYSVRDALEGMRRQIRTVIA